jgi:hypothetical protein
LPDRGDKPKEWGGRKSNARALASSSTTDDWTQPMTSGRKEKEGSKERESWVGDGKKRKWKRKRQPDKQPKIIHFENNSNYILYIPSFSHAYISLPTL